MDWWWSTRNPTHSHCTIARLHIYTHSTMQWFLERGFEERGVEALPESRRDIYNWERKSKIYMKDIITSRQLDAEELFYRLE